MKSNRREFLQFTASGIAGLGTVESTIGSNKNRDVTVSGRVVDHGGEPAAARKVHLTDKSESGYIDTDSDGVFRKSVPENSTLYLGFYKWGSGQLHAPELNHVPHIDRLGKFDIGTSDRDIGNLQLGKAYKVDLRAVDSDGRPYTDVQFGVGAEGYGSSDHLLSTTDDGYLRIENADFTGIEISELGNFVFHMEQRYAKEVFIDQPTTVSAKVGGEITVDKHGAADLDSPPAAAWVNTYGSETNHQFGSVVEPSTGGYLAAGIAGAGESTPDDGFLVKVGADGSEEWSQPYGSEQRDVFYSVVETLDGGYLACGSTESSGTGSFDGWLIKVESDGSQEWTRTFGGSGWDEFITVIDSSDGGYLAAGLTESAGPGTFAGWLVKTGSEGDEQWTQTYGGSGSDWLLSVTEVSEGGYLAAGRTETTDSGRIDGWLVKIGPAGSMEWNNTYSGSEGAFLSQVIESNNGGYLAAGGAKSTDGNSSDGWLVKVGSDGTEEWAQTYGGEGRDVIESVVQLSDGSYLAAGRTKSIDEGDFDGWLVKVASDGTEKWTHTYGGSEVDWFDAIIESSDGGYLAAGTTGSVDPEGADQVGAMVKLDTELGRFDTNDNGFIEFDEVLSTISAFNTDEEHDGELVGFTDVLDTISAFNNS